MSDTDIQPVPSDGAAKSNVLRDMLRLLTFRSTREELSAFGGKHLAFGLACAWVVGMGRYWDNPRVGLAQHLGVGSVVYVFVLAALLWVVTKPLSLKDWSYLRLCAFIALVSPPAVLYAIPVEKFCTLETANSINLWFLAIVATWRVALWIFYLCRAGQLRWWEVLNVAPLPLTLIVTALTLLNLERVVFNIMGGLREAERSGNDVAYEVLALLTFCSIVAFIPLFLGYVAVAVSIRRRQNESIESS